MNKSIFFAALVAVVYTVAAAPVAAQNTPARMLNEFRLENDGGERDRVNGGSCFQKFVQTINGRTVYGWQPTLRIADSRCRTQVPAPAQMSRARHSLEYVLRYQNGSGVACINGLVHFVDSPTDIKLPAGGTAKLTCHIADS